MPEKEPYFGSVRFFKNMILVFFLVCILVPTALTIYWSRRAKRSEAAQETQQAQLDEQAAQLTEAEQNAAQLSEQIDELEEKLAAEEAEMGVLLDEETPAYQSLYPDFYVDTPLPETTAEEGVIYLTFDDGPSYQTDEILSILKKEDIKATFFVVGKSDSASIQRMKNIVAAGHTLGMHSYSHDYAAVYASVEDFLADYYKLFVLIRDEVGVTPTVFRFPGGSVNNYNAGIYQELIAEMLRRGFRYYDWSLSAEDAASPAPSAQKITQNILDSAAGKGRAVVLMHDSAERSSTVEALPAVIDGLREMGYTFAPLDRSVKPIAFGYYRSGGK